ncbi:unnamed protein product [Closterium sp. Yama58-4]|nr:unnamed protein product [Closterium sp. Yama58-4]
MRLGCLRRDEGEEGDREEEGDEGNEGEEENAEQKQDGEVGNTGQKEDEKGDEGEEGMPETANPAAAVAAATGGAAADSPHEESVVVFAAFEFVPSPPLSQQLQECGPMPEDTLAFCLRQVVEALHSLHSHGITHGNVRPSTVFVPDDGVVRLAGVAWLNSDGHGAACRHSSKDSGVSRLSPEAIREVRRGEEQFNCVTLFFLLLSDAIVPQEEVGPPSDIWALGCLAVAMATGAEPWADITDSEQVKLFIAHSRGLPELPPDSSPEFTDFVASCLNRDPSKRPTAATLMSHPFLAAS